MVGPRLSKSILVVSLTLADLLTHETQGLRETYWTITFKNDLSILQAALEIFVEEVGPLQNVSGIILAIVTQPITTDVIRYFSKNGGNCLGVHLADGPLQLINIATMWSDPSADGTVLAAHQRMVDRTEVKAVELGVDFRYLY